VRIVLDTNVVMSALLWRGKPFQLLEAIAAAVAARADIIVSGDSDLLSMGSHRGINILSAAVAVESAGAIPGGA